MKTTELPVIVTASFDTSKERLWSALTNVDEMCQWFFENIPDFNTDIGFKTQFEVRSGERIFTHQWKILEYVPNEKLTLNWNYQEYPGDSTVSFLISEEDNHTKLTLTHKVLEDFPTDIPEFKRESCLGGWNYFIKTNLTNYLKA
ncbi:SRPBCC domain-containing protein [Psychroserpens sp. XS_ASV72]|uniref:SRPBCC family protein n=1 Tax=Psychroserpens sp. XS_ASV72 TaxID=3241293 RepID=UPI003517BF77